MDALIHNLDESAYRAIRARAALEGRTIGEAVTDALRAYLARTTGAQSPSDLLDPSKTTAHDTRNGARVDEIVFLYCI